MRKDGVQYGNGQEEQRVAGRDPALMIWRQAAGGNDAMDMIMGQQVLTPGVQDGEESDLCAQPFGIGSRLQAGPGNWRRITGRGDGLGDVSASGFSSWGRVKTT